MRHLFRFRPSAPRPAGRHGLARRVAPAAAFTVALIAALGAVSQLAFPPAVVSLSAQGAADATGWQGPARLTELPDLNPDPRIVEINLDARLASVEIAPGERVEAWTYNGVLPGPIIRVQTGDRLIVHFSNHLPQPTTVHWHGLRLPIGMDGVPGVSQPEVPSGGSFTYDFVVPDAGLFWYHPHVMSAAQVGFGLYGALLADDPETRLAGIDEQVLVLSDIEVNNGKLEDPESGGSTGMAFGREGNRVLVNGRELPMLKARAGVPQRWRIVNAAKSRYFELDPDNQLRFVTIGGDGGLQETAVERETLVIAPGERLDTIVTPRAKPGQKEITVDWRLFNRGYGSVEARIPIGPFFTVALTGTPPATPPSLQLPRRTIEPLSIAGAKEVKVDLTIGRLPDGAFQYGINGVAFQKDKPFTATPGEIQVWNVVNTTEWSHPFHIHGFFFQVLDANGAPVRPLAWKDTVDVPFKRSLKIAVKFDTDRPGLWMFHCHVLDHADGGLMGTVQVGPSAEGQNAPASHHH